MKRLLPQNKSFSSLVLEIFSFLYEKDEFKSFETYSKESIPKTGMPGETIIQLNAVNSGHRLTGLFLKSSLYSVQERNRRRAPRWFEKPFSFKGEQVFLSTQWNSEGEYQLTLNDLNFFLKQCYYNKNEDSYYKVLKNDELFEFHEVKKGEINEDEVINQEKSSCVNVDFSVSQKIFFGAPGTGKSHKVNQIAPKVDLVAFRTTFHPDYDYAQFVGSYKPKKEGSSITYSFVPQVFAKAYVAAWNKFVAADKKSTADNQVYLVIEEINRGSCAQIFGDLFQLLDRNENGFSDYSIDADSDFTEWLKTESKLKDSWSEYVSTSYNKKNENGEVEIIHPVSDEKIALPPNFNILATMNTSDQSLFPMDSAFKRRFDWEYVPIKYAKDADCGDSWNADKFVIKLDDDTCYSWLDFLSAVNDDIYEVTQSEDKQMGEFFVKPSDGKTIDLPTFCSKVLFYLWDSVYKDDDQNKKVFRFDWKFDGEEKNRPVTFQSLFEDEKTKIAIVQKMMENLDVKDEIEDSSDSEQENESNSGITPSARGPKSIKFSDGTILDQGTRFDIYKAALEKIGIDKVAEMAAVSGYHRRGRPFVSKEKYPEIENDSEFSYVQIGEYNVIKGINNRAKLAFLNYLKKNIPVDMTIEE